MIAPWWLYVKEKRFSFTYEHRKLKKLDVTENGFGNMLGDLTYPFI